MSSSVKRFNVVKIILNKSIFDEHIIHVILTEYWQLLDKRKVLLDWINIEWLSWKYLSENPNAIDLLKIRIEYEHNLSSEDYNNLRHKIDWCKLSANPNAIDLLKIRIEYEHSLSSENYNNLRNKIDWGVLSRNPNVIELLTKNQDKIDWESLSLNPNAMDLLK